MLILGISEIRGDEGLPGLSSPSIMVTKKALMKRAEAQSNGKRLLGFMVYLLGIIG
jgi:hypothetical protein